MKKCIIFIFISYASDTPAVIQRACFELGVELPARFSGCLIQRDNAVPWRTDHDAASGSGGGDDRGCLELACAQQWATATPPTPARSAFHPPLRRN